MHSFFKTNSFILTGSQNSTFINSFVNNKYLFILSGLRQTFAEKISIDPASISSIIGDNEFFISLLFTKFNVDPRNELEKLRLDLSNCIKNKGGGWKRKESAQNVRKKFLASALWYVDSRSIKTLLDQIFKIPDH